MAPMKRTSLASRVADARLAIGRLVLGIALAVTGAAADDPLPAARRLILVSLDGLRPDAIAMVKAPTLAALIADGVWAKEARTILPSSTLPSHTSMLTGLVPARHGVMLWNDYEPERGHIKSTTILELATQAGRRTAMFAGKEKFWHLSRGVGTYRYVRGDPDELADAVIAHVAAHEADLMFVHFAEPDSTGHRDGWLSAPQLAVIERVDAALGRVKAAVDARPWGANVVWIVTADHGGHERTHGTPLVVDMRIPWICAGPGIRKGVVLDREVRTYDTAATALSVLGLPRPDGLDGKPVDEICEAAGAPSK